MPVVRSLSDQIALVGEVDEENMLSGGNFWANWLVAEMCQTVGLTAEILHREEKGQEILSSNSKGKVSSLLK